MENGGLTKKHLAWVFGLSVLGLLLIEVYGYVERDNFLQASLFFGDDQVIEKIEKKTFFTEEELRRAGGR